MTTCDRCYKETYGWTMSYFNTQEICLDCSEKEKELPRYADAKKAEAEAVKRGDYNFRGIGL